MGNKLGITNQTANPDRAHIVRRVEQRRNRSHVVQPGIHAYPAQVGFARNHFNLGIRFMQKRCRFQRALSCADDCDSLPCKLSNIPPLEAVKCLLRRKPLEDLLAFLEGQLSAAITTNFA